MAGTLSPGDCLIVNLPTRTSTSDASGGRGGHTEQYWYDGEGERIRRRRFDPSTGTATYYFGGVYEEDFNLTTGQLLAQRYLYQFNGQVVAQRQISPDPTDNAQFVRQRAGQTEGRPEAGGQD